MKNLHNLHIYIQLQQTKKKEKKINGPGSRCPTATWAVCKRKGLEVAVGSPTATPAFFFYFFSLKPNQNDVVLVGLRRKKKTQASSRTRDVVRGTAVAGRPARRGKILPYTRMYLARYTRCSGVIHAPITCVERDSS